MSAQAPTMSKPDIRAQWLETCQREIEAQTHITINMERLDAVIADMKQVTDFSYWRNYVSEVDDKHPDLDKLAYDMALTTGMIGGYILVNGRNKASKWQMNGSGSDAMFSVIKLIREAGGLPDPKQGKPYGPKLRSIVAPILEKRGVPRPDYRLAVYEELGNINACKFFSKLMQDCYGDDGFQFTCSDAQKLAWAFPTSFGGDDLYKKASLYFLFMSLALNELGFPTKVTTLVPSEYRLPQIFAAYGVIEMSTKLKNTIKSGIPLKRHSEEVRVLRQASVLITEEIMRRTGLPLEKADGSLYMMTKTPTFARRAKHMPHMMVDTVQF